MRTPCQQKLKAEHGSSAELGVACLVDVMGQQQFTCGKTLPTNATQPRSYQLFLKPLT